MSNPVCSCSSGACVQGCPSTAVQWGAWAAAGMAAADPGLLQRLVRQGYGALSPHQGLSVLASAVSTRPGLPVVAASPFDFAVFLAGAMCGDCMPCVPWHVLVDAVLSTVAGVTRLKACMACTGSQQ